MILDVKLLKENIEYSAYREYGMSHGESLGIMKQYHSKEDIRLFILLVLHK